MGRKAGKSIEWADWVWNLIQGKCPADPPCWYCYMRGFHKRFGMDETLRLNEKELTWKPPGGSEAEGLVFVGSNLDMFHPAIPLNWIDLVWMKLYERSVPGVMDSVAYALLSKYPKNYDFKVFFPKNTWIGATWDGLKRTRGNVESIPPMTCGGQFISFEPLLAPPVQIGTRKGAPMYLPDNIGWIIIGANSNRGAEKPPDEWADMLIEDAAILGIPVWLKENYRHASKRLKCRPNCRVRCDGLVPDINRRKSSE